MLQRAFLRFIKSIHIGPNLVMDVFTHGVFVTNNQISKYLEAFSKKGLYWFVLFNFLKKIKKRSERSVNYIWRYILFKLRKCVKIT